MQQDAQRVVALLVVAVVLLGAHLAQHDGVHCLQGSMCAPLGTGQGILQALWVSARCFASQEAAPCPILKDLDQYPAHWLHSLQSWIDCSFEGCTWILAAETGTLPQKDEVCSLQG